MRTLGYMGDGAEPTLADGMPSDVDQDAAKALRPGSTLGRYVILGHVGAGGMGVVLQAYDQTLDRRVALKVLHASVSQDPEHHARLVREARSLAKLSHRAVVGVYDVGEIAGQVFVAMEYIDGPTVRAWLRMAPRSTAEILAVFRDAARGLIAAHDAGIVHRDFKPDNVFVDGKGRAHVGDFGLAVPSGTSGARSGDATLDDIRVTEAGVVMGTPAYMSVEQHAGAAADHRTDQFAFCVSLYEALCGVRPFQGTNGTELCASIQAGVIPPPPPNVGVPKRVHRALERGMRWRAADRHPSMRSLLAQLRPRTRDRRLWIVGGLVGVMAGVTPLVLPASAPRPCRDASKAAASMLAAARRGASETPAVSRALAEYAEAWGAQAEAACASVASGVLTEDALGSRLRCLEQARSRYEVSIDLLEEAADERALSLAVEQLPLSVCTLDRTPAFEIGLETVELLRLAGRMEEARARLDALGEAPDAAPSVRMQLVLGRLERDAGHKAEECAAFGAARIEGLAAGDDLSAAEGSVGFAACEPSGSSFELRSAASIAESIGAHEVRAHAMGALAVGLARAGSCDDASAASQDAVDVAISNAASSLPAVLRAHVHRADALLRCERPDEALRSLDAADEALAAFFGTATVVFEPSRTLRNATLAALGRADESAPLSSTDRVLSLD
ncbi:MAG: protein kinase [Myxococcota bacterium]